MTIAQITAIISLLVAFNVPHDTVVEVEAILKHTAPTVVTLNEPMTDPQRPTPTINDEGKIEIIKPPLTPEQEAERAAQKAKRPLSITKD